MKKITPRLGFTLPALWLAVTAPAQTSTTIDDPSGVSSGRAVSGRFSPERLGGALDLSGSFLGFLTPSGVSAKLSLASEQDGAWEPSFSGRNLVQNYYTATGVQPGLLNSQGLLASWCDTYSINETGSYAGAGPSLADYYKPMFDPTLGGAKDGGGVDAGADADRTDGGLDPDWADHPFGVRDHGSFRPVNDLLDSGNPWDAPAGRPKVGANPARKSPYLFANQSFFIDRNSSFALLTLGIGANASAISGIDGNSLVGIGTGGPAGNPQIEPVTPEPSILALVGMGAASLLLYRRRFGPPQ